jgi:phosphatidylglycerol:prolipoprotein diacylglycerol transferase
MLLLAESYLHRLDPVAIPLRLPFMDGIRWYGLAYAAGFLIAWLIVRWMARSRRSPLRPAQVGDLMTWVILGVLLGGRLGYCLFYEPRLLIEFTGAFPYWQFLAIFRGGMASHGGVIGVIVACWLFGARRRLSVLNLLDIAAFCCPPGLFLGRIANFVNGELWGRPLPPHRHASPPWWSIKYPEEITHAGFPHLDKLEPLRSTVGGDQRFLDNVVEAARAGNAEVIETITPLLTPYYPSQIIQALTDGPLLMLILVAVWWKPRRPGVVGSWFLLSYGVMRVASEFVRQPDAGVAVWGGLSRGQWLSVLMAAAGVVCLWIASRRRVDKLPGLAPLQARAATAAGPVREQV